MSGSKGTLRDLLRSGAGVAVAMAVMNVGTYGFTLVAARMLGPREYSAVAALMGLLLVVNVLSLGLQATGARQVAAVGAARDEIENRILVTSRRSAWALGAVCLALSPLVTYLLQLDSWVPAAMVALTAVPLTIMGGQAGILQGEKSWTPLAGIYLAVGLGRLGLGAVGLLLLPSATGAMAGVLVGAVLPVLVGGTVLRRRRGARAATSEVRSVLAEVGHNSHALLAFFALSNADVVLARAVLDSHDAGLYAGGLILTKAVLFLPQFVVVLVFPSMASEGSPRMYLKGVALVGGIGALATAGAWLVGQWQVFGPAGDERSLVVEFVGGAEYAEIDARLWMFALLGTVLAMMQVIVYEVVARQNRVGVYAVWAGLLLLVAVVAVTHSTIELLALVLAVDVVVLGILMLTTGRASAARAGAEPAQEAGVRPA